jgi:hypothetical protein
MANAQQAIDNLHNTDFMGNPIILSLAELVEPLSKDRKKSKAVEKLPKPAAAARNQYGGVRLGVRHKVSGLDVAQQLRIHLGLTGSRDLTK